MSDNRIKYALYTLQNTISKNYCKFYDNGSRENYKRIVLLNSGELVYANTVMFIDENYLSWPPECRYLGTGFVHDVLIYTGLTYTILYPMGTYKEELLNRRYCVIKYTEEGDRYYGTLLSEEELKRAFNW